MKVVIIANFYQHQEEQQIFTIEDVLSFEIENQGKNGLWFKYSLKDHHKQLNKGLFEYDYIEYDPKADKLTILKD